MICVHPSGGVSSGDQNVLFITFQGNFGQFLKNFFGKQIKRACLKDVHRSIFWVRTYFSKLLVPASFIIYQGSVVFVIAECHTKRILGSLEGRKNGYFFASRVFFKDH